MAKKMKRSVDGSMSATSKRAQHQNVSRKISKIKKKEIDKKPTANQTKRIDKQTTIELDICVCVCGIASSCYRLVSLFIVHFELTQLNHQPTVYMLFSQRNHRLTNQNISDRRAKYKCL